MAESKLQLQLSPSYQSNSPDRCTKATLAAQPSQSQRSIPARRRHSSVIQEGIREPWSTPQPVHPAAHADELTLVKSS